LLQRVLHKPSSGSSQPVLS